MDVDFFFAPGSRYSYLAASRMAALATETGCTVAWRPVSGAAIRALRGHDPFVGAPVSGQYDWSYRRYDAECWADYYGIPFREPVEIRVDPASLALACLAADRQETLAACCRLLQRLIFVESRVIDDDVIAGLAGQLDLDASTFQRDLVAPETRTRHDGLVEEARTRGAFGVPTFFLDDRMFWGNDRLVLLEAALAGTAMPR